jgi:hypothetical protein
MSDPDDRQADVVTADSVITDHGWTFLRAMLKEGSFNTDSEGRPWWWRKDFERDAALVRREGRDG